MMAQILNTQHSKFIKLLESLEVSDLDLSLMFDVTLDDIQSFKENSSSKDHMLYLKILSTLDIDVIDFFTKDTDELNYESILSKLFTT